MKLVYLMLSATLFATYGTLKPAAVELKTQQNNVQISDPLVKLFIPAISAIIREYARNYNHFDYMPALYQYITPAEAFTLAPITTPPATVTYRTIPHRLPFMEKQFATITHAGKHFEIPCNGYREIISAFILNEKLIVTTTENTRVDVGSQHDEPVKIEVIAMRDNKGDDKILWKDTVNAWNYTPPHVFIDTNNLMIYAGFHHGCIRIWDLEGNLKTESQPHRTDISSIRYTDNGSLVTKAHTYTYNANGNRQLNGETLPLVWQLSAPLEYALNTLPYTTLKQLRQFLVSLSQKNIERNKQIDPAPLRLSPHELCIFESLPPVIQRNICTFFNCDAPADLIKQSNKKPSFCENCCIQ